MLHAHAHIENNKLSYTCLAQDYQESCPSILALSPDSFADLQHEEVKAFRMPAPPVPLFV